MSIKTESPQPLPPVGQLLQESWNTFTGSILNLLLLGIVSFIVGLCIWAILGGLAVIVAMKSGLIESIAPLFTSLVNNKEIIDIENINNLSVSLGKASMGLLIVGLLAVIAQSIIATMVNVSAILFTAKSKERPSFGAIFRQSFQYVLPLFMVGFVAGLLIWGGLFVFLFPAVIIGFFLMFSFYEVVLGEKRGLDALRSSVHLVSQHFGGILVRVLLYFFGYILIVVFIPNVILKIEPRTGMVLAFTSFITNTLIGWFSIAYSVTLYKQVKEVTPPKQGKLIWFFIIALIGWLIAAGIGLIAYRGFSRAIQSGFLSSEIQKARYLGSGESADTDKILTYAPSVCGLSVPIPKTTDSTGGKERRWYYEELQLSEDSFFVLDKDVFPVTTVLGAMLLYKDQPAKPVNEAYNLVFPGFNIYCVDNVKSLTHDEYVSLALTNKKYKVTTGKKTLWGEVLLTPVWVEGESNGKKFKEPAYLGESKDGSRLWYIKIWSVEEKDPIMKELDADIDMVIRNMKYRDVSGKLSDIPVAPQNNNTQNQKPAGPSCLTFNIREGEFASNKCYSQKDYDDLSYYINQFNSAVGSYNGASSSMSITCSGSDFFKNQCEQDKKDKQKAEEDMGKYRGIIQGIIARGK